MRFLIIMVLSTIVALLVGWYVRGRYEHWQHAEKMQRLALQVRAEDVGKQMDWAAEYQRDMKDVRPLRRIEALISDSIDKPIYDMTSSSEPDPDWECIDSCGHVHRWILSANQEYVPSVRYVEDEPETSEHPPIFHYECRECGDHVDIGWRRTRYRRYM